MNDIDRKKQLRADAMLLLVTTCWGVSYGLTAISLREVNTFMLTTYRFLGAFLIVALVAFPHIKKVNMKTLKYSMLIGFILFIVYIGCTYAVICTSLSNAGFLCALPVVFTPLIAFLFQGKKPDRKFLLVIIICVLGIALLTLKENLTLAWGDLFAIGAAVAYAVDLLITENAVKEEDVNAFQLGMFQLLFTGVFSGIFALIIEEPSFPKSPKVFGAIIFLTVFCTGLAFIVQAVAQQYTSASHVGVIFTLEPVFSGIVAFLFFKEVLIFRAYVGAVLLIGAIFIMEYEPKKKKIK